MMSGTQGTVSGASLAPKIIISTVFLWVLTTAALCLRFYARRRSKAIFQWDDYLVMTAWLPFTATCVSNFIGIRFGSGKHLVWILTHHPTYVEYYLIYVYVVEIIYTVTIWIIKCSICSLYIRIFWIKTGLRMFSYFLIALTTVWALITIFLAIFQCHPVKEAWNPLSHRKGCINLIAYEYGTNIVNVVIDVLILTAPIHSILKLKVSSREKMLVMGIILLGAGETVFSIIRLVKMTMLRVTDPTWQYVDAIIWSTVEPSIGIVCACVPTWGPLLPKGFTERLRTERNSGSEATQPCYQEKISYNPGNMDIEVPLTDVASSSHVVNPPGSLDDDPTVRRDSNQATLVSRSSSLRGK